MKIEKTKNLLEKYYRGETTLEEEQHLRTYFETGHVPEELKDHAELFQKYDQIQATAPAKEFDPLGKINFNEENQKPSFERAGRGRAGKTSFPVWDWSYRIAAGFILLLIGFAGGRLLNGEEYASTQQVAELQHEVQQMKDALMNTENYSAASAGERLSAVNLSTQIPADDKKADRQITDILIYTMNNDKSVNVRQAATEALFRFSDEPRIRQALIASLTQQDDAVMQITLIDMLVELKAKGAINEMEKMLVDTSTREIVKNRLKTGIAQLKV